MLKKMKKAFTITELVIVIAVIAILAAVLIPTFTTVVNNANESAAMQEARSEFENFNVEALTSESGVKDFVIEYKKDSSKPYYFVVKNGQFNVDPVSLDANVSGLEKNQIQYNQQVYTKLADPVEGESGNSFNDYQEQNAKITIYLLGESDAATTVEAEGAGV